MITVLVCGAKGKMGREVLKAVHNDPDLKIVGAVDTKGDGGDVGDLIGAPPLGVTVSADLAQVIETTHPDVMVDFTSPASVLDNIRTALNRGVCPVVGTTGLTPENLQEVRELCGATGVNAFISPNFSIGAVLMMKLAEETAKYLPQVEIIELHHDQKLDAPSGTALLTAQRIEKQRGTLQQGHPDEEEKLSGVRGGNYAGIRIHSVRLPGYVASQEVIFGGLGQTLRIRHDSISRESFMPGVVLACKKILQKKGLVYGLEEIL